MKKPSGEIKLVISVLSVAIIILEFYGVSTPELIQSVIADVLIIAYFKQL